jgi:squalene-hopene/tetraprenyl-beta-curcumene cyclase
MEESGTPHNDQTLQRGLKWLTGHQQSDGAWHASSINKERDPKSDPGLFMSDAATAYAVLALEEAKP